MTSTIQMNSHRITATPLLQFRFFTIAIVLAIGLSFFSDANANPREAALSEQAAEEAVAKCNSDPECRAAIRKEEARRAAAEAAYQAKPLHEKAIPWLVLFAIVWGIWKWAGTTKS